MSTLPTPRQRPGVPGEVYYPSSDDEPMAETTVHVLLMVSLIAALRQHFRARPDVFVIGNIFWYYEEGNPKARRSPDVMVVKGVEPKPADRRRSFKSWEERVNPCAIIELTSAETKDVDREDKYQLYEQQGVREYFLFDPLGEYLPQPLLGYRLVGGQYRPIPPTADGGLVSEELGLRLVPAGEELHLFDAQTGARVLAPPDAYEENDELRERAEAERRAREAAGRAVEAERLARAAERQAREAAERAAEAERLAREAAEREIARLRALLKPPAEPGGGP